MARETPEQKARSNIDVRLGQTGRLVQNRDEVNLSVGRGVAVREFKLGEGYGQVDYQLYLDGNAVGAVEAKRVGFNLLGVKPQIDKYSNGLPANLPARVRPLPFLHEEQHDEP